MNKGALALLVITCDHESDPCPLIGCESVLAFDVLSTPSQGPITIALLTPAGVVLTSRTCMPTGGHCSDGFVGFAPDTVVLRVTWTSGTVSITTVPAYAVFRPNGATCPPECRYARIVVQVA